MRKMILPLLALAILFASSCKKDDENDFKALTGAVNVTELTAEQVGDKIIVTWNFPEYEHLASFEATDMLTETTQNVSVPASGLTASCEFNATGGNHTISVSIIDIQGNASPAQTVDITVNGVAGLVVTDLTAEKVDTKIVVSWTVPNNDEIAGFVATDDASGTSIDVAVPTDATTASCEFDATFGNHTITVVAKDALDNLSDEATIEVYVNNIADVYVVVQAQTGGFFQVFKNGTSLGYDLTATKVTGMDVDGENIYVSGYRKNASNKYEAVYWLNGAEHVIATHDVDQFYAYGIKAVEGNVYVAGIHKVNGSSASSVVVVWDNDAISACSDTGYYSLSTGAIDVQGTDVYVGYSQIILPTQDLAHILCKNGVSDTLGTSIKGTPDYQTVVGVSVMGENVVVATNYGYYKNSEFTTVTESGVGQVNDAVVDANGAVYASGYEDNAGVNEAKYWIDGTAVVLENQNVYTDVHLDIYYGTVYVSGSYSDASAIETPVLWESDGTTHTPTTLDFTGMTDVRGKDVVVVERPY